MDWGTFSPDSGPLSHTPHPTQAVPAHRDHGPCTSPTLPTTQPAHTTNHHSHMTLQQFDPGRISDILAQKHILYDDQIFLTFFDKIMAYGFCNICVTGQIPPFLLHEGSGHLRMGQYQNVWQQISNAGLSERFLPPPIVKGQLNGPLGVCGESRAGFPGTSCCMQSIKTWLKSRDGG